MQKMKIEKLEDRPPYVTFETRSIEDRDATIQAGHYVGRDVDFAFITPFGSKDRIERNVAEWFEQLDDQERQERIDPAWVAAYKKMYAAYKQGLELPPNGIPVVNWPGLSPSQVKQLLSLNLRAVEDVAAMNEECIGRLGMGGRALKDRAIAYLEASNDVGKVAEDAAAMRAENADLKRSNEELLVQVKALAAQVEALAKSQAFVQQQSMSTAFPQAGIQASDLLEDEPAVKPSLGRKL